MDFIVHESWQPLFTKWSDQLKTILAEVYSPDTKIKTYPPQDQIFNAFSMPVSNINVVLLGQDVYHGEGQAMGLAFSVPPTVKIPPSLVNIFTELSKEFPERKYQFKHGDLTKWSINEGIMLLNSALTVKQSAPLSHIKKWEKFTDAVIQYILDNNKLCVFLLLGNYAKNKTKIIQDDARCVKGVHPSPLSAHNGFFNSNLFIDIEKKLNKQINWQN
jgi:uracil-DNA glycosylase